MARVRVRVRFRVSVRVMGKVRVNHYNANFTQ